MKKFMAIIAVLFLMLSAFSLDLDKFADYWPECPQPQQTESTIEQVEQIDSYGYNYTLRKNSSISFDDLLKEAISFHEEYKLGLTYSVVIYKNEKIVYETDGWFERMGVYVDNILDGYCAFVHGWDTLVAKRLANIPVTVIVSKVGDDVYVAALETHY